MPRLSGVIKQLQTERNRVHRQLAGLDAAIKAFASVYKGKRRRLSAKARAKIAAAQRARWAKVRARKKR